MGALEAALRSRIDAGQKCFVPYISGGLGNDWTDTLLAASAAGADAVEIGIPFSDPVMDGTTIQAANDQALSQGATPQSVLSALRGCAPEVGVPTVIMTYANIAHNMGYQRFAESLADAGVSGVILPDLPLEELDEWSPTAKAAGLEVVLLAAPTGSDERLELICERSQGFVYGVGLAGITGVREQLAASAAIVAKRLKALTDKPVLVGVGVGTPEQACEVSQVSDGVVVGSAIVAEILSGSGPIGVGKLVGEFRSALDTKF